jgi:hypothetical protein
VSRIAYHVRFALSGTKHHLRDFAPPQFTISKPPITDSMDSPGDTEPDIITWESVRHLPSNGDFARLIPTSHLARNNFSHLVSRLKDDPLLYPHARRVIYYEPVAFEDETSATDGSCTGSTKQEAVQAFCGFYRLNMSFRPGAMSLGWVLGSSRAGLPDNSVDCILTPFPGMNGVRGRHCRLERDLDSGILILKSDCRKEGITPSFQNANSLTILLDSSRRYTPVEARPKESRPAAPGISESASRTDWHHDGRS